MYVPDFRPPSCKSAPDAFRLSLSFADGLECASISPGATIDTLLLSLPDADAGGSLSLCSLWSWFEDGEDELSSVRGGVLCPGTVGTT
jgi:hypothetical protein